jgi:16S rRNA (adenine1518-N6/adenine1519-N6)-dimethyltransferase
MQITHAFLKENGLLPHKSAAQYLLTDSDVVDDTVSALDIRAGDRILEIGAGCGVLTERILDEIDHTAGPPASLTSIEIDDRYVNYLRNRFGDRSTFNVIKQDILRLDMQDVLDGHGKVVGNIPYYISGPILRLLFDNHAVVTDIVMMLQKEVGMRVVSRPSDEYFGLLSIMRLLHYDAAVVRHVDRRLFMPVPKVDSIVIKMHVHEPLLRQEDEHTLIGILKHAFSARRKMIKNTLKAVGTPSEVIGWCKAADIDINDRAENIDLNRWIRFLNEYKKASSAALLSADDKR